MMDKTDYRPDGRAWIGPLVSTLLTLPMGFGFLVMAMLSPMMCDSCGGARAEQFEHTFAGIFAFFVCALVATLGLLIVSWALPWLKRNRDRRATFAVAAPGCLIFSFIVFCAVVNGASTGT